jgi:hypothetical protein
MAEGRCEQLAAGRRPKRGKKRPVKRGALDQFDGILNRSGALLRIAYYAFRFWNP